MRLQLTSTVLASLALIVKSSISLSLTLGDHMVLQRDAASPPASIWGLGAGPGQNVRVTLDGVAYPAVVNETSGLWVASLPPTPAGGPHAIVATASDGSSVRLDDVLFGDVYFWGGQSNMAFQVSEAFNATAEIATANNYPQIVRG